MYADNDLGTHPLFPGGFINFGYWEQTNADEKIRLIDRISSQVALYDRVLTPVTNRFGANLLEVDCGKGYGAMLAIYDHDAASVVGVDASPQQIERSQKTIKGNLVGRVAFKHAEAEHLPFDDKSFDVIYSVEAIQHFHSTKAFFSEAHRTLKTGGRISFCTFYATSDDAVVELQKSIQTYRDGLDTVLVKTGLEEGLKATGFRNVGCENIGAHVWDGFTRWSYQVRPKEKWQDVSQWISAYQRGLIDYGILTATK